MALGGSFRAMVLGILILLLLFTVYQFYTTTPVETASLEVVHIDRRSIPEEPVPGMNNVFFLETSCSLSNSSYTNRSTRAPGGGLRLSPRSACALEAAARAHPQRHVYFVHTCPVDTSTLRRSAPRHAQRVLALPNVHLWAVPFATLARGSVLERLLNRRTPTHNQSKWMAAQASDALRVLLLERFGGTYIDLDMLLLRPLGDLHNFAALWTSNELNNAIMDFALDPTGQEVTKTCLREMKDFHPKEYTGNGAVLITRVLKRRCGTDDLRTVTPEMCGGFHILPISAFYAVPCDEWEKFFQEDDAASVMKSINDSFGIHLCNSQSSKKKITISLPAKHPYAKIARRVCPRVVSAVGDAII